MTQEEKYAILGKTRVNTARPSRISELFGSVTLNS